MKEQFYTILTAIGKAKIANASAMGTKLNITKLQVGDGGGSYYNPTENQEQLKNKVWEGNIGSITIDKDNNNWIVIETLLPGDIGGFMIREAGILDSDGNLIAVGKYPETYKPITSQGSLKDLKIKMILEITNTSSVTLKVDPTVILATQKDVQSLDKQIKDYGKQIGDIKDLKTTNKDNLVESMNELFTNVDDGKSKLYSAITDKKVTPRSKDFSDLVEGIKDIKLGQGNAQASEVLSGKTFTNDTGIEQTGTMPNMGSKEIEPKTYTQELGKGYYDNVKVNPIDTKVLQNSFPNLKPENIAQGVSIGGIEGIAPKAIKKSETFTLKDMKKDFEVKIKLPNNVEKEGGIPTYDDTSIYKLYVNLEAKSESGNYKFSNNVTFYHWGTGTDKRLIVESYDKDKRFTNFGNGSYSLYFSSKNSWNVYNLTAYISFELHKGYSIIGIILDNFPEKNEKIVEAKLNYSIEYISNL